LPPPCPSRFDFFPQNLAPVLFRAFDKSVRFLACFPGLSFPVCFSVELLAVPPHFWPDSGAVTSSPPPFFFRLSPVPTLPPNAPFFFLTFWPSRAHEPPTLVPLTADLVFPTALAHEEGLLGVRSFLPQIIRPIFSPPCLPGGSPLVSSVRHLETCFSFLEVAIETSLIPPDLPPPLFPDWMTSPVRLFFLFPLLQVGGVTGFSPSSYFFPWVFISVPSPPCP